MGTEPVRAARLDPLALPPATFSRFLLLVIATLAGAVHIYAWLAGHLAAISEAPGGCARTARGVTGAVPPDVLIDWYAGCLRHASLREAVLVALALAGFLLLTVAGYLVAPRLVRRGRTPLDSPVLTPEVRDAVRAALPDTTPRPEVLVDLASRGSPAHAFGRFGRHGIVVSLRAIQRRDATPEEHRERFRALLAHETAHIRNRDVDLTYLAVAVWWSFLPAALLPLLIVAVREPALLPGFAWRVGGLLLLLFVIRAGVFRIRECYADVAAVRTREDETGLIAELESRPSPSPWSRQHLYHPATATRIDTIRGGPHLFRLDTAAAAALGALVGLAYTPTYYLSTLLLPGSVHLRGWLCGVLFGGLGAAVMTGSIWRATLWDLAHDRRAPLAPAALALAGGVLAGQLFVPDLAEVGGWRAVLTANPVLGLATAGLLLAGCFGHLAWNRFVARQWLATTGHPVRAYRFAVAQSAVTAAAWLAFWFQLQDLLRGAGQTPAALTVLLLSTALNPVLVLSLVWTFAYPLAIWRADRRRHAYWRDPGAPPPGNASVPAWPLPAVYGTAAGVILGYWLIVRPAYPALRSSLDALRSGPLVPGSAAAHSALLLLLPALVCGALGGLALGAWAGGPRRSAVALAAAGSCALPAAAGLLVTALQHIAAASPQSRTFTELVIGLAGGPVNDGPAYPALGLMTTALYAALVIVSLPAALLGSLLRSAVSRTVAGRHVRRPGAAGQVARMLPLVLCAAAVGGLSLGEWSVPQVSTVRGDYDPARVDRILAGTGTTGVPVATVCSRLVTTLGSPVAPSDVVADEFAVRLASATSLVLSSDDATLRAFGSGARDALQLREVQRSAAGMTAALQYCATILRGRA